MPNKYLPSPEELATLAKLPRGVVSTKTVRFAVPGESSDEGPECIVAEDTHKLRSIFVWINGKGLVEATSDGGAQIVAINEKLCNELNIPYDPTQRISMVSANGTLDESLGLARDVAVEFLGGITAYFQMHVVRNAPYDILLGRPFEALLSVKSNNSTDGKQTLHITCPNTKKELVIPTYARGEEPPTASHEPSGFRTSRI